MRKLDLSIAVPMVHAYYQEHGHAPTKAGAPWLGLGDALKRRTGKSWEQFIKDDCGLEPYRNTFDRQAAIEAVRSYYNAHGVTPSRGTKPWSAVAAGVQRHLGKKWRQFLAEDCELQPSHNYPASRTQARKRVTPATAARLVRKYAAKHGTYPKCSKSNPYWLGIAHTVRRATGKTWTRFVSEACLPNPQSQQISE